MNHTQIGDCSEQRIITILLEAGYRVFKPVNTGLKCDIILETCSGFLKIQIKTAWVRKEQKDLTINTFWQKKVDKGIKKCSYKNFVDLLMIYAPHNSKFYILDPNSVGESVTLRLTKCKSNQKSGVNFAKDFELSKWIKKNPPNYGNTKALLLKKP